MPRKPSAGLSEAAQAAGDEDEERERALYGDGSESSSDHASDEDVPRTMWLPDFEPVSHGKKKPMSLAS